MCVHHGVAAVVVAVCIRAHSSLVQTAVVLVLAIVIFFRQSGPAPLRLIELGRLAVGVLAWSGPSFGSEQ